MFSFAHTLTLGLLIFPSVNALGPAPVPLRTAGNYVILAKAGITIIPVSHITGAIGVSPISSGAGLTGFTPLLLDGSGTFATSAQVTGKIYAANYAAPTPAILTAAIGDMETAYVDAAGRPSPNFVNLNAGSIGGLVLTPGLYKWSTAVTATQDVTLTGTAIDTWIFQIAGTFALSSNKKILLIGGALAQNVVWVIAGSVDVPAGATFEGIILAKTNVNVGVGATVRGRIFAQTSVKVNQATVSEP